MNDLEAKLKKRSTWIQIALIIGATAILSPILLASLKGLMALVAIGVILSVGIMTGPLWGRMLANWTMKAAIAEATRNPIETMWNNHAMKLKQLEAFQRQIEQFVAKVMSLRDQYHAYVKKYGPDEATKMGEMLNAMQTLLTQRKDQYYSAQVLLGRQKYEIEKAEAMYEMALSAKSLKDVAGQHMTVLDEVMEKTALRAVNDSVNSAFAQLESKMLERVDEGGIEGIVLSKTAEKVAA